MRRKILLFSVLLAIIAIIVTALLVTAASYRDFFEAIKKEVMAEAHYISMGYELAGEDYLINLKHQTGHRLTVISTDGMVIHDSSENSNQMNNHLSRPEVQSALRNGTGESTRYSDTSREQTYYYAILLADDSVLRMSSTTSSILDSYDGIFWIVALIAICVLTVSIFIASLLTRRIVRPINAIDLDHPENNTVYDEIIPLLKRIKDQRIQIERQIAELDRGRREFEAITGNMNEGFLVLGRSGNILSYNKSAVSLLSVTGIGFSDTGSSGSGHFGSGHFGADYSGTGTIGDNILAINRSEVFRTTVQAALNGDIQECIVEIGGRSCQLFANPVVEDDTVQGVVLLLMDVTEKQEREKLRREFSANVSHELKTPLTVISGYAEIIANSVAKTQDIPEFSQKIYREAGRLIALVNDLMFLSGLEENTQPAKESVNLLSLCEEVVRRLKSKADERGVNLSVSGDSVEILGIATVLEEMVYNLTDNAIKYSHEGGSALISIRKENNSIVLSVTDTGIGISESEHERIFERFYRVDKSRNKAIPGTGLGLSIVKHGAILHDAKIELDSAEGSGTIVTIRF